MVDIAISAVLGALGGLVGGLIAHLITRRRPNQKLSGIITTVCVVIAITISRQPGVISSIHEWIAPKSRVEKTFENAIQGVFESNPAAMARLKAAKDPALEVQMITAGGVKRLDDDDQLERAKLLFTIASSTSAPTCAGFFSGALDPKVFFADMEKIPDETLRAYAGISKKAVVLELQNAPFQLAADNEVGDIVQAYIRLIGGEDGQQLQDMLLKPPPVSAESNAAYCKATKTFFGNIQKLDKPSAAKMLRYIAAGATHEGG